MPDARPEPDHTPQEVVRLRAEIERLRAALGAASAEAESLRSLAHEDALTGLLNRRGFVHELSRGLSYAQRYGAPAAVLLVDLDRFKPINDGFGHEAGDAALRHAATLLRSNLRASDLIGRIGGDEFAILLWQVAPIVARQKADSLETVLAAAPCEWRGASLAVSASIGSAPVEPRDDVRSSLARADAAMYRRKAERRRAARERRAA